MGVSPSRKPAIVGVDCAIRGTSGFSCGALSEGKATRSVGSGFREPVALRAAPPRFCSRILPAYWAASLTMKLILGREGSKYGILDYTELKYVCVGGVS